MKQHPDAQLLFIGDSITHGWEGGGKEVWQKYYEKRHALNLGIGGDQTQHVLWRLDHGNLEGLHPKLAVVMIGTNNAGAGNSPKEIADGVKAVVDQLRTKVPGCKVLLLAIFPRDQLPTGKLRKINDAANEMIAKFADNQNVFYLDIGQKFLGPDGSLPKDIMPDLLHPNAKGYEIWATRSSRASPNCSANRHEPLLDRRPDEPDRRFRHSQGLRSGGPDESPDQPQHRAAALRHARPREAALYRAVAEGRNAYSQTQGIPPLLAKLQVRVDAEYGQRDRKLFVTSGTSGGLMLAPSVLVNPGDEVLFFDPYFVMYKHLTTLVGGKPVLVETYPNFRIDLDKVRAAITERTKVILCNSPGNPTGTVLLDRELEGWRDWLPRTTLP